MNYNPTEVDEGFTSEWNEGNFKNLRLHEAQEMINIGKINPFGLSEDGTSWNYQIWQGGIDILLGEGLSKYATEEITEVKTQKNFVEELIKLKPPFKRIIEFKLHGKTERFIPIPINQKRIKEILQDYENIVKKLNDLHGLSTRNRDTMDDGL